MSEPTIPTLTREQFLQRYASLWRQGEHTVVLGPTGSGKTYMASCLAGIRAYVCVLAVKKHDDTLKMFTKQGYKIIKTWPPNYDQRHIILWVKPENLSSSLKQTQELRDAMNAMYQAGGWCIYFDEAGYIAGHLKLGQELGVLLNQGRSSHISVICTMTRPHSVVGQVPLETLNQARHMFIFRYKDEKEIKSCAAIAGISYSHMVYYMQKLSVYSDKHSDCLYIGPELECIIKG